MRHLSILVLFSLLYSLGISQWAANHHFVSIPGFGETHILKSTSFSSDRGNLLSNTASLKEVTLSLSGTNTKKLRTLSIDYAVLSSFAPAASFATFFCSIGCFLISVISQIGLFVLFRSLLF